METNLIFTIFVFNTLSNEDFTENEKRIKTKLSSELELIPQLPKK